MDQRFKACLPYTLREECPDPEHWSDSRNFSNDPHDPGGETMCGITQREYNAWRHKHGLKPAAVQEITETEGEEVYYENYWLPYCPALPPGMDLAFFDAAVNEGSAEAIKMLQHTLGITADGVWGPLTDRMVQGLQGSDVVMVKRYTQVREAVYRTFRGYRYFGRGWERRSAEIGLEAVRMA
jgi:lysozyme family protein